MERDNHEGNRFVLCKVAYVLVHCGVGRNDSERLDVDVLSLLSIEFKGIGVGGGVL